MVLPASPNFICCLLQERYRRDYFLDYVYMFYVCKMCMLCIVFNLCQIWLSEKLWGDPPCAVDGISLQTNKNILVWLLLLFWVVSIALLCTSMIGHCCVIFWLCLLLLSAYIYILPFLVTFALFFGCVCCFSMHTLPFLVTLAFICLVVSITLV